MFKPITIHADVLSDGKKFLESTVVYYGMEKTEADVLTAYWDAIAAQLTALGKRPLTRQEFNQIEQASMEGLLALSKADTKTGGNFTVTLRMAGADVPERHASNKK